MDKEVRKRFYLVFHVAAFLFITIFFILPYLVQISTYFHERGHQIVLDKYGVENSYSVDILSTIPNFFNPKVAKLGATRFDLNEYYKLNDIQRTEVHVAGIISDLRFLFLICIYLTLVNIYTFYKIKYKKNYNLTLILAINWILFMWLLALIQITVANVTSTGGDIFQLIKLIRVV